MKAAFSTQLRRRMRAAAAVLSALVIVPTAVATAWTVDDDGPADFPSIQHAINSAYVLSGDTILVKPGHYRGYVFLLSKDLVIRSEAGPFVTILDGEGSGSVVSLQERSAATVLEGFTITGGRDQQGGGIWIFGGGPIITRNIVQGNSAVGGYLGYGYGGGIEIYGSAPVVTHNVIRGNSALDGGGGIDVYYAGPSTPGTCCPVLSENTIVDNVVTGPEGMGGGVLAFASAPRITSSIVSGNQAAQGGGLFVYRPQGVNDAPDATVNLFFANTPDDSASTGGFHLPPSNRHEDPRLGSGPWIDLWPRSDSPALDAAEATAPASADLTGTPVPLDSDLNGTALADIGALEGRGEITNLSLSRIPSNPAAAELSWDDTGNPSVLFHLYAQDGDPFRTTGGVCLAASLAVNRFTDATAPARGLVRFYLVTGRGVEEGPRGYRSDGSPRPSTPACGS